MAVVVQKFGGSSVADVDRIRRVAERVVATRRAGKDPVVVVSAMGKTTDELLALARQVTSDPDKRELDMLLTAGERISMSLLAMAIRAHGYAATSLTGSQCGILTNDSHAGARIIEIRPFRIQDALARGEVVIVAGFQGVSYKREVTTLGRGGSDTTAVALAAALDAEACEIYSDVDGVYTGDPRVVVDARRLDALSYEEMLALARSGAKVLNADAVEFARRKGIVIFARAAGGDGGETIVRKIPPEEANAITGVATRRNLVRAGVTGDAGEFDDLASALAEECVVPLVAMHDGASRHGEVIFGSEDVPRLGALRERLQDRFGDALDLRQGECFVSLVGTDVGRDPKLIPAFRVVVERALGRPARGVYQHGLTLSTLCDPPQADDVARALHAAFVDARDAPPETADA